MGNAQRLGELPVRTAAPVEQRLERTGLLDRLEILAHAVLDELVLENVVEGGRSLGLDTDKGRQAGDPRCTKTAFAGDDDPGVRPGVVTNADWLKLTAPLQAGGEAVEFRRVELLAGLVRVRC